MSKGWLGVAAVLLGLAIAMPDAEARRLGGARSLGVQRSVTAPPPAAVPAKPGQAAPAAAPAAVTGSKWAPVLGGLALGGLIGAFFAGNPILGTLLTALALGMLVFAGIALVRMLRQPRTAPPAFQYAGLGSETVAAPPPSQAAGFDARTPAGAVRPHVPEGFDVAGFLRAAKENFIRLQMANDSGRLEELRDMTTTGMFETLRADPGAGQQTDVVTLNADLLEVATEGGRHWASVRFSGLVRETPGAAPASFEEVWNLMKPADGSSGWLLAGIQQMH
ncbi:MAG: Tim44-like domain-containing protein [Burkholderiales bacterium]